MELGLEGRTVLVTVGLASVDGKFGLRINAINPGPTIIPMDGGLNPII